MAFIIRSYSVIGSSSGSQPRLRVRLPCASASTSSTFLPACASPMPRLAQVVVLAVPPFWLARLITCASIFYCSFLIGAKKPPVSSSSSLIQRLFIRFRSKENHSIFAKIEWPCYEIYFLSLISRKYVSTFRYCTSCTTCSFPR